MSRRFTELGVLLRLLPFIRPHARWLGLAALCGLIDSLQQLAVPFLMKFLADAILSGQRDVFAQTALLTLFAVAVGALMTFGNRYATARYTSTTVRDLRNTATQHIQRWPIAALERTTTGDLLSRLNNDVDQVSGVIASLTEKLWLPLVFAGAVVAMLLISWQLLLAGCVLIPLAAFLTNKASKRMGEFGERRSQSLARVTELIQDAVGGIQIVKAFNMQPALQARFGAAALDVQNASVQLDQRNVLFNAIWLGLRYPPQLIIPLFGGYLALTGQITVGSVLASSILIWSVFLPVETLLGWVAQLRQASEPIKRILEVVDAPTERSGGASLVRPSQSVALALDDVSFRYAQDQTNVLSDVTFDVPVGKVIALVGPSGSGKSTVLKLACSLYSQDAGRVWLFGQEMNPLALDALRQHVSLVSQDTYLFPVSIADNIGLGRLGATRDEIVSAAIAAGAHDFILQQPHGYDTPVGERGALLSGGQRQRIAIARAMLKRAPLLLLDEPTSALDAEAERAVQTALTNLMALPDQTVLIVAHRLSTIRDADEIIVLNRGRIVERGTHVGLMARDGLYRRLYASQAQAEEAA
jgi:subfamily B ATP-binding cassette protein MsbA/ATP-binding cassette subfamily B protein AbcA/BmrA